MKLAKALRLKNKLVGVIGVLQERISQSNVSEGDNKPSYQVSELYQRLCVLLNVLSTVKTAISRANTPIQSTIFQIAESKGMVKMLKDLNTRDGVFASSRGYGESTPPTVYHAQWKAPEVDAKVAELEAQIEKMQDDIDAHNAVTEVDVGVEG